VRPESNCNSTRSFYAHFKSMLSFVAQTQPRLKNSQN
jgi:hypothetical protein